MEIISIQTPKEKKKKRENWSFLEREKPLSKLGQPVSSAPVQEMNHILGLQSKLSHRKMFA